MQIDAESRAHLEEVRKGKARKFVMVVKGVRILNLIVYRFGSEARHKQVVKRADGSGQFFGGVVSGKGKNIVFELHSADYDRVPGKSIYLRQFLQDEAGMAFKPVYELVEELTFVEAAEKMFQDDEDEEGAVGGEQDAPADESAMEDGSVTESDGSVTESDGSVTESPGAVEAREEETATAADGREAAPGDAAGADVAAEPESRADDSATASPPMSEREQRRRQKTEKIARQLHELLDALRPEVDQVIARLPDAEDDLIEATSGLVDLIRREEFIDVRRGLGDLQHAVRFLLRAS